MANHQSSQSAVWSFRWLRTLHLNLITTGSNRIRRKNCKNKLVRNTSFVKLSCNRFLEIGRSSSIETPFNLRKLYFRKGGQGKEIPRFWLLKHFSRKIPLRKTFSINYLTISFKQAKKKTLIRVKSYYQDL